MLSVHQVSLSFGGTDLFKGISFQVNPGDRIGLVGRNGAGKSTLLRCINRLVDPSEGRIAFRGHDVTNLRGKALDGFQMDWWGAFRPHLTSNASAYIWGNAPDLWRLWYAGGLGESEVLELRNEIVWDKLNVPGMASPELTQYPEASERCLFFQLGNQFRGNINAEDFPETWEPLRAYMEQQAKAAGITPADVKRVCGVGMYSHWFTRSQFNLIPEARYEAMAAAYPGYFARPWADLKSEWDRVKGGPTSELQGARSYFDNAHEPMTDVWKFPRVIGDDRHGHATPKPVAMMEKLIRKTAGVVLDPFFGSGSTGLACVQLGRKFIGIEIERKYFDIACERIENAQRQTRMFA